MRVNVERLSSTEKKVDVFIPPEEVNEKKDEVFKAFRKQAKIKGFRPGKAPRNVIEGMYKYEMLEEVSSQLISESFEKALQEASVSPVSRPRITPGEVEADKEFHYAAVCEVIPEFEVEGYKELQLEREKTEVTDEDVEKTLERLRERQAEAKPLEEDREVREGDFVIIDYKGTLEGETIDDLNRTDAQFPVGEERLIPEFEENLIGMRKGEEKDFEVTYPEDFEIEEAAGKTVSFHLTLKDIREKVLPELSDDFAEELGEDDLESLRESIREDMEEDLKQRSERKLKEDIVDELIEKNPVEAPSSMVSEEVERLKRQYSLSYQRYGLEVPEIDRQTEAELRVRAERNVKTSIILGAISRKEGIQVSEEEVNERLKEISESVEVPFETVKQTYQERGMIDGLEAGLIEDKVIDFITQNARIEEASEGENQIDTEP